MTISLKGLGSGIDYTSWIDKLVGVKQSKINTVSSQVNYIKNQKAVLSNLKTNFNSLLTSIEAFTQTYSSNNVFNQKAVKSSSDSIKASVDSNATVQSLKVSVEQLATATTAKSVNPAASYVDETTKISDIAEGAVKEGVFSVYIDGTKNEISVGKDDYVWNILGRIDALNPDPPNPLTTKISASITNGKLTIEGKNGHTVVVGTSSDTSNFTKVMSLTQSVDNGPYSSSKSIFDTNSSAKLTETPFALVTTLNPFKVGTFKIGHAEFTIDETTTLKSLVKDINDTAGKKDEDGNSIEAGVTAFWDPNAGKLVLTATDEGAVNINIEAGTSNFTDIMGLTTSTWNTDGSIKTTQLAASSQDLGDNAKLSINDTSIISTSNTVTSDISGIKGLTLDLLSKTTDKTTNEITTATVDITPDTKAAVDAITAFVNAFNTVISSTDTATSSPNLEKNSKGALYGESALTMARNSLRTTATAAVTGGDDDYKSLADIGITTGALFTEVSKTDKLNNLVIDSGKLETALKNDPEAVKKLLVGDSSTGVKGVLTKLDDILEYPLDLTKGYFVKRDESFSKQEDNLNDKIEKMNRDLTKYKNQLEAKFAAMDKLISGLNSSQSIFNSYFNKSNSSSSSSSNS